MDRENGYSAAQGGLKLQTSATHSPGRSAPDLAHGRLVSDEIAISLDILYSA